ncbi:hypothetical protein QBC46DRAFT_394854 [Diplogelasinospora grovesii]|uniref:C2H2-type domain-containing protein n=1 Tax=Diplogelasinospora grovesii TaxID=303347 RepID=A0AAN6N373_9PEZI|nr:hypothetical protein QBC46DRAFT_394854 [Diplogelasinospora grovesii]
MKESNYKCDDCGHLFAREDTLRRHMKGGCLKCDHCGLLFPRKATLRTHMEKDGCKISDIGTLELQADAYWGYRDSVLS